jgi:DNA-binding transcriptional ArsR family regulator
LKEVKPMYDDDHCDDHCDEPCRDAPHSQGLREALLEIHNAADGLMGSFDRDVAVLAVALLYCEELCVCDMAWLSAQSHEYVTGKLETLRSEGLVGYSREGEHVQYHLTEKGRSRLSSVLGAQTRASW